MNNTNQKISILVLKEFMDENIGLFITQDVYSIITHNYVCLVKPKFGKKVCLVGQSDIDYLPNSEILRPQGQFEVRNVFYFEQTKGILIYILIEYIGPKQQKQLFF